MNPATYYAGLGRPIRIERTAVTFRREPDEYRAEAGGNAATTTGSTAVATAKSKSSANEADKIQLQTFTATSQANNTLSSIVTHEMLLTSAPEDLQEHARQNEWFSKDTNPFDEYQAQLASIQHQNQQAYNESKQA